VTSEAGFPWDAPAPNEHGKQWIEIELDHPVNPWEHEGAGSISWGANLDRLAPLGEEAVSIIKELWERRQEDPRERAKREAEESSRSTVITDLAREIIETHSHGPSSGASIKPGWRERVEFSQYWIHLTLYQPFNQRWVEERGENWSHGGAGRRRNRQAQCDRRGHDTSRSESAANHRGAARRSSVQRARDP
jgi:hypothetical protein